MGTPTQTVINELTSYGSKHGEFIQEQRRIDAGIDDARVNEGFCKGVCLDWARRVIGGGRKHFSLIAERQIVQTDRQGMLQAHLNSRKINATTKDERRRKVYDDLRVFYNLHKNETSVAVPTQLIQEMREFLTFTPESKYTLQFLLQCYNMLQGQINSANNSTEVSWAAFARRMDEYHTDRRLEVGKGASKRKFSDLRLIASTDREPFQTGALACQKVLNVAEFTDGRVIIAGFGLRKGGTNSGHAVAFYKQNTGKLYFLDPNYGIYDYNSQGASFALRYLFAGLPTNIHSSTGITHVVLGPIYGEDGWTVTNGMSYLVLAAA